MLKWGWTIAQRDGPMSLTKKEPTKIIKHMYIGHTTTTILDVCLSIKKKKRKPQKVNNTSELRRKRTLSWNSFVYSRVHSEPVA